MKPIQPPAKRTHIVVVGFCMFALLVITVSLGGSCRQEPPRGAQTTTPSPTPTGSPTDAPRGDTPIIVKGGGSIDLDFEESIFSGTRPVCANCRITRVELEQIKDTGEGIPTSTVLTRCPFNGDATVLIETKDNRDNVTVKTASRNVEIDFPAGQYPGVITQCGDESKRHSKDGEITGVKVNNNPCGGCTKWKRCRVTITVNL